MGKTVFILLKKPTELISALIEKHSNPEDLVLDCFLGSGTTALASANTGRNFIGCELDKEYYDKTVVRLREKRIEVEE